MSQNTQDGLQFHAVPGGLSLPYDPVYLDGSTTSFLDLIVEMPSFGNHDFQFSFAVYINHVSTYFNLLHYKYSLSTPSGITELRMWSEYSGYIYVSKKYYNGLDETWLAHGNQKLLAGTWYSLSMAVDISSGKIAVFLGTTKILNVNSAHANLNLDVPGALRVGASFDDVLHNIDAMVTCLIAHRDNDIWPLQTEIDICTDNSTWQPFYSMFSILCLFLLHSIVSYRLLFVIYFVFTI